MTPYVSSTLDFREPIRFATLNVRGLNSRKKQYQLQRLLADHQIDFLAVQETKMSSNSDIEQALCPLLGNYEVCVSHAVGMSAGCFLLLRKSVPLRDLRVVLDERGRFILCDFILFNREWRVMCVYAPNRANERTVFFEFLKSYLQSDKVVVLMGDFNCVCSPEDRASTRENRDISAEMLIELLQEHCLEDVARARAIRGRLHFTYYQRASHSRLDRIYVSTEVISRTAD